jgi:hypothetical protein
MPKGERKIKKGKKKKEVTIKDRNTGKKKKEEAKSIQCRECSLWL